MDFLTILFIALGLSMDSFAVSVTSGLMIKKAKLISFLKFCFVLASFQAIMPLIGWLLGKQLKVYIESSDHWVAFILLLIIGGKMIWEGSKKVEKRKQFDPFNTLILLGLGLATSIDALVIGLGFGFLDVMIIYPVLIIGITTFIAAVTGIFIGGKLQKTVDLKLEILGGLVLIGIGIKILIEHLIA
jgi:manganese efflux pump family protein